MFSERRGLFIVFEGMDKAGKTTLAKNIVTGANGWLFYQKGFCSATWIGRLSAHHPSTLLFLVEIFYLYWKNYFKRLRGTHIVHDRYFASIACHLPDVARPGNALLVKLGKFLLPRPDVLIYCAVSKEERMRRLKEDSGNPHHLWLIKNHKYIDLRENIYCSYFNQFKKDKLRVDTSVDTIENSASKIIKLITKNGRLFSDRQTRC